MSPRTLAVLAALLTALAAPAGASAATLAPLAPCYVTAATSQGPQSQPVNLVASGFTPSALVDLTIDGQPVENGTGLQTNAMGGLEDLSVPAPFIRRGSRDFTVTLTEQGNPANTVSATTKTTALRVDVKPKTARPSATIRFKGSGFIEHRPVWAHYIYRGKLRKTVKMVGRTGECGTWTTHKPQFPLRSPALGTWLVQFDQRKRLTRSPPFFVQLKIRVA